MPACVTQSRRHPAFLDFVPSLFLTLVLVLGLAAPRAAAAQDSLATTALTPEAAPVVAAPAPAADVVGVDGKNDSGKAIELSWSASPDEQAGIATVHRLPGRARRLDRGPMDPGRLAARGHAQEVGHRRARRRRTSTA